MFALGGMSPSAGTSFPYTRSVCCERTRDGDGVLPDDSSTPQRSRTNRSTVVLVRASSGGTNRMTTVHAGTGVEHADVRSRAASEADASTSRTRGCERMPRELTSGRRCIVDACLPPAVSAMTPAPFGKRSVFLGAAGSADSSVRQRAHTVLPARFAPSRSGTVRVPRFAGVHRLERRAEQPTEWRRR